MPASKRTTARLIAAARPEAPARRRAPRSALELRAELALAIAGQSLASPAHMALLRAVADKGSITAAARAAGMSYKGAWEVIERMTAHAAAPLVERASGGRGGGGTRLTAYGRDLLARYEELAHAHQRFVQQLGAHGLDLSRRFSVLETIDMKTSARNQWSGTIAAIRAGAVNDEVEIRLPGGERLVAIITRESTDALALRVQQPVMVLVRSSAVLLASGLDRGRVSARNRIDGSVQRVQTGAVNAEITVRSATGFEIVATITQASATALALQPGVAVSALVKASDVVLVTAG